MATVKATISGVSSTVEDIRNSSGSVLATLSAETKLQAKTATANGDVTPDSGYDALSKVTVNVPSSGITPSGTKEITENGTFDVTEFASALVNVASSGGNMTSGTFTISEDDATAYATSQYTVDEIDCAGGNYIIIVDATTNAENITPFWIYSETLNMSGAGYSNNSAVQTGQMLLLSLSSSCAQVKDGHPLIKAINSNFPLRARTYRYVTW